MLIYNVKYCHSVLYVIKVNYLFIQIHTNTNHIDNKFQLKINIYIKYSKFEHDWKTIFYEHILWKISH